jgi:hypothetical protein
VTQETQNRRHNAVASWLSEHADHIAGEVKETRGGLKRREAARMAANVFVNTADLVAAIAVRDPELVREFACVINEAAAKDEKRRTWVAQRDKDVDVLIGMWDSLGASG